MTIWIMTDDIAEKDAWQDWVKGLALTLTTASTISGAKDLNSNQFKQHLRDRYKIELIRSKERTDLGELKT